MHAKNYNTYQVDNTSNLQQSITSQELPEFEVHASFPTDSRSYSSEICLDVVGMSSRAK